MFDDELVGNLAHARCDLDRDADRVFFGLGIEMLQNSTLPLLTMTLIVDGSTHGFERS
jgi:hypothetical protein